MSKSSGPSLPLFPYVFTFAVNDSHKLGWDEWLGEMKFRISQTPQVILDNQIHETSNGSLVISWDYVAELLPSYIANKMFYSFTEGIKQLAKEKSQTEAINCWAKQKFKIPVHPDDTRLIQSINNTIDTTLLDAINGPNAMLLHDLVIRRFLKSDSTSSELNSPAILSTDTNSVTYLQLLSAIGALSKTIQASLANSTVDGIPLVGIFLRKGWRQIVAVVAILLSGAAYVPLDLRWPAERLKMCVDKSSLTFLLVDFEQTEPSQLQSPSTLSPPRNLNVINFF